MIIIRNETQDDVSFYVGEKLTELSPNKVIQITLEQFKSLYLGEHVVKLSRGIIKIKGLC